MSERKKILQTLETPYSAVEWPKISQEDQDAILELLCQLLAPIGTHRRNFVTPSKGKRKREKQAKSTTATTTTSNVDPTTPPPPEIATHIDVGLSQISRALQKMSSLPSLSSAPPPPKPEPQPSSSLTPLEAPPVKAAAENAEKKKKKKKKKKQKTPYTLIFSTLANKPATFHCHLPQMVALASPSPPPSSSCSSSSSSFSSSPQTSSTSTSSAEENEGIRLIAFSSRTAEQKLSAALGIPRVSSLAIRTDVPQRQTKPLLDFVREKVAPVEIAWLKASNSSKEKSTAEDKTEGTASKKQRTS